MPTVCASPFSNNTLNLIRNLRDNCHYLSWLSWYSFVCKIFEKLILLTNLTQVKGKKETSLESHGCQKPKDR